MSYDVADRVINSYSTFQGASPEERTINQTRIHAVSVLALAAGLLLLVASTGPVAADAHADPQDQGWRLRLYQRVARIPDDRRQAGDRRVPSRRSLRHQ